MRIAGVGKTRPAGPGVEAILPRWKATVQPRSGETREFPEADCAEFFEVEEAKRRINAARATFLSRLTQAPAERPG